MIPPVRCIPPFTLSNYSLLFDLLIWCWTRIWLNSSWGQRILLGIRLKSGEEIGDKPCVYLQDVNRIPLWDNVWHSSITDCEFRGLTTAASVWDSRMRVCLSPAETALEHSDIHTVPRGIHRELILIEVQIQLEKEQSSLYCRFKSTFRNHSKFNW